MEDAKKVRVQSVLYREIPSVTRSRVICYTSMMIDVSDLNENGVT